MAYLGGTEIQVRPWEFMAAGRPQQLIDSESLELSDAPRVHLFPSHPVLELLFPFQD
jgi:hypothetical protein